MGHSVTFKPPLTGCENYAFTSIPDLLNPLTHTVLHYIALFSPQSQSPIKFFLLHKLTENYLKLKGKGIITLVSAYGMVMLCAMALPPA